MQVAAADWVAHYARTQPTAPALRNRDTGETRTWAELDDRVARLAHALRNIVGLPKGARIATVTNGDLRCFELQFACARAGLVLAPLNFRLTATELAAACEDISPGLLVVDAAWEALGREAAVKSGVPQILQWGAGGGFDALASDGPRMEAQDVDPDAPLLILFTSGTTGKPKAAVVSVGGLVWQALNQVQHCAVAERGAHVFTPLPLFHAGGLNSLSNPVLYFGGAVTVSARFDPEAAVRFVGDPAHGVTHIGLVPVMFQMMAETAAFQAADFSSVRTLLIAGGRLTEPLSKAYGAKGLRFTTQYGGTETGPTITSLDSARADKAIAGSCGQQALHVDIRLVDPEGKDVPQGLPGEVWVKGPAVIPRYLHRDKALDFSDGWFRTGDVAWMDEEGFYFLVDRVKDMYKSGGENVYPAEVEQVLIEHPAVAEVAVIGVANEKWGEVGLAVVVAARGQTVTLDDLRAHCEGRLARFKQPQHLALLDAMPRNVTGKIAKQELRAALRGSNGA